MGAPVGRISPIFDGGNEPNSNNEESADIFGGVAAGCTGVPDSAFVDISILEGLAV